MYKTVGQPCKDCGVPYVAGVKGAYCKPCYIKWKNGTQTPATAKNAPQASFDPIQNDLQVKIDEINQTIAKMRTAFQNHEDRIKDLETFALGANKTAFDLHSGHTGIPVIGATSGDMPKIEFPEGFLKQ